MRSPAYSPTSTSRRAASVPSATRRPRKDQGRFRRGTARLRPRARARLRHEEVLRLVQHPRGGRIHEVRTSGGGRRDAGGGITLRQHTTARPHPFRGAASSFRHCRTAERADDTGRITPERTTPGRRSRNGRRKQTLSRADNIGTNNTERMIPTRTIPDRQYRNKTIPGGEPGTNCRGARKPTHGKGPAIRRTTGTRGNAAKPGPGVPERRSAARGGTPPRQRSCDSGAGTTPLASKIAPTLGDRVERGEELVDIERRDQLQPRGLGSRAAPWK